MMRIARSLIIMAVLAGLMAPALAQFTKSTIDSQVATQFPDNSSGAITPAILRAFLLNLVNSYQQFTGVNAQTGTTYTFTINDYGQLVTFNNSGAVAVTLPQATGTFTTWNTMVNNVGSGTVTITPTTSTINGASTVTLGQNQGIWIVSDGTNYQTFRGFGTGTISGPGSTTSGDIVTWANSSGTSVADTPILALIHGGSNCNCVASNGGIVWSNASELQILAGTATANQILLSGATATPAWSTATFPTTVAGAGQVLNSTAANVWGATATATLGVNATTTGSLALANGAGSGQSVTIKNPSTTSAWEFDLPTSAGNANQILTSQGGLGTAQSYQNIASLLTQGTGITLTGTTNVTISLTTPVTVANGGIGVGTLAAHGSLVGEGTGAIVSVTTPSTGQCLLSNGSGSDPTWGSCSGGSSASAGYGIAVNGTTVSAPYTAPFLAQSSDL